MIDGNYYGSQKMMTWVEMMQYVAINDSGAKGSYVRRPFVSLIPVVESPNAHGSMLVYYNDKKGAPLGKGERVRETDGPMYSLVKQFQKGLAPYFWCKYLGDQCNLRKRCLEKWMECFENQDCVGWEETEWDPTTGKVTNKFLDRETFYTDTVLRQRICSNEDRQLEGSQHTSSQQRGSRC